jgi:class 3 adenylate cyclase
VAFCTHCGEQNPGGFRFCGSCGAALAAGSAVLEERKVVSVVFCDLVGFTASAHSTDPEDVRRMLGAYQVAVRREFERFGGAVEKFIGDAVVGVWGVPQAHEDDAERAVRAALAVVHAVDVDVRIAVNTGEVLATLTPEVGAGVGVVGDVVNTASRLQAVAPVGGILAGETTVRLTSNVVEYHPFDPVTVKGKPQAVAVWRAVAVRAPASTRSNETPLYGRVSEMSLLQQVYGRARDESMAQLVSVIGEPGIGKSRLVAEFERWLDTEDRPIRLHGRCLAYGDGMGLWPLSEAVKQHLNLTETDGEDEARRRLERAVAGMGDAGWVRARLAPLVGLEGEGGERDEAFTAWQRFFDEIALRQTLVLVFDDLHWAHPTMLAFVHHLAEWSTGVPLMVVCTARPELLDAHPHWGAG